MEKLIKFLNGEADFDGVWFGEKHPTEEGQFWWRKHLRASLTKQSLEAEIKKLADEMKEDIEELKQSRQSAKNEKNERTFFYIGGNLYGVKYYLSKLENILNGMDKRKR